MSIVEIMELFLQLLVVSGTILKEFVVGKIKETHIQKKNPNLDAPRRTNTEISFY